MAQLLRLLALTMAVTALAGPACAAGAERSPVARAQAVARGFWGANPCHGNISVLTHQTLRADLDAGSDAWVTFGTPIGANVLTAPSSTFSECRLFLTSVRWPTRSSMRQDWDMLCMTVVHEYGHLLGQAHDATPGSVMAPVFADYSSEPRRCRTTSPRG